MEDACYETDRWKRDAGALRRLAAELVGAADAEDVVQDAYRRAVERPPTALSRKWLAAVVRNRGLDRFRKAERRRDHEARAPERPEVPDASEVARRLELHRDLTAAVQGLRPSYRQVLYLRYFEDLGPRAIAERTGSPVKTVKTRLARALEELRGVLRARHGTNGPNGWIAALAPLAGLEPPAPPVPGAAGPSGASGPAAAVSLPPLTAGAALMSKHAIAVAAGLVGVLGVWVWRTNAASPPPPEPARPAERVALAAVDEDEGTAPPVPPAPARSEARVAGESLPVEEATGPARDEAATAGALVVRVLGADGEPAEDVAVTFETYVQGIGSRGLRRVATGADGVARAGGLPPGTVLVRTDRGGGENAEVEAGEVREVVVLLPDDLVEVRGRVVDGYGAPVADAAVWLTSGQRTDWLGGRVVARTDAGGSFELAHVPRRQSLGALARGFAPSSLVDLALVAGDALDELELVLAGAGGAVRGRVLGRDGSPVAGADVALGGGPLHLEWRASGDAVEAWTPRTVATDADGAFAFEGVAPGEHPLAVRSAGHPIAERSIVVEPSVTTEVDVRLEAAARVEGVVRDEAGEPVPGALLRALASPVPEMFLQSGQFDVWSAFGHPWAVADDLGHFRLEPLASGTRFLYASSPADPDRRALRRSLNVTETVRAAPGEVLTWNPVLSAGRTIRGRVAYADGVPMTATFVIRRHEETGALQVMQTDDDGRFHFANQADAAYTLTVQLLAAPAGSAPAGAVPPEVRHVRPDGAEVRLVADFPSPIPTEPASVAGRIDDQGERIADPGLLRVHLGSLSPARRGVTHVAVTVDGNRFEARDVEPGSWRVLVYAGDQLVHASDGFELAPGEARDLGILVTGPAGSAVLRIERAAGTETVALSAFLRGDDPGRRLDVGLESEIVAGNLNPGRYRWTVSGEGVARETVEVDVAAGARGEAAVTLRPAVACAFEVRLPEDAGPVHVRLTGASGEAFWEWNVVDPTAIQLPIAGDVSLPLGRYVLGAETDSGRSGSTPFEVVTLDASPPPVVLDLR